MRKILAIATSLVLAQALGGVAHAAEMKRIAVTTIVEVPQLIEVKNGLIEGLKAMGYVEGKNLSVDYKNAQGNFGTAQQIARQFVGERPDVIVPITTPSAQTVVAATKDIPVVFSTVTDPLRAKVVSRIKKPGANVTGVSDFAPIAKQLDLIKEILPKLKKLGFVYNPGLDNSLSYLETIKAEGGKRGIEIVPAPAPTANDVVGAGQSLVGKVDAIYVPNDTTVVAALEALVKLAQDAKVPLFTGETRGVERGAVASISYNYTEVGRITAGLVKQVLDGKKPGDVDVVFMADATKSLNLFVNKTSAAKMGVSVPQAILSRANKVF